MNARIERWHRVSELFDRVADLNPEERRRILAAECADDPELRKEVERLLSADERTNPLDHDIAAQASALLLEGDPHEHEGECFGPYRIVKLLGQGGMGRVYLAQREGSDFTQTVALKLVGGSGSFDAALARRRFLDERRMLARLQHPHIARLLDGGVGPEAQPWFAMEYVDGAPLTEWCDAHQLGIAARLEMFAKVCDAVDHAHRFLIVHRDIKPGNVLVDERGEPKVLDFGIAKLLDEGDHARTGSTILMTPDYAAPEQIRGGQISTATDVYALGAVLFEVLTGRKPFADPLASREPPQASRVATEGTRTGERAQARSTTAQALRKRLRGDIDRILRTALDPDPARRYGSAATLAQDLRAVVAGQPISLRSDRAYRVGIFLRRHRLGVAAASLAILGLLGTTGWALWQTRQTAEHARMAMQESRTAVSVKNLVSGLLSSASPEVSLGRQLTVKEVLDNSRRTLPTTLAQEPAVAIELLTVMARSYLSLEDYTSARSLADRALAVAPKVDSQRQIALHILRAELGLLGNDPVLAKASADILHERLPSMRDAGQRVEALIVLGQFNTLNENAVAVATVASLKAALSALPKSDIRRIHAASALSDWAINDTLGKGDHSATLALLMETLVDAERHLPRRHPATTSLRKKLALLNMMQNDPAAAVVLLYPALENDIAVYGNQSRITAQTYRWIAQNEQLLGRYDRVAANARNALDIFMKDPTTDPVDLATTQEMLADAQTAAGNDAEAQRWYQAAHAVYSAAAEHGGMQIPYLRLKIAATLLSRGKNEEAEQAIQEVLRSAKPGSAAEAVAWSLQGTLARRVGNPAAALELHARARAQLLERKMAPQARAYRLRATLQEALDQQALGQDANSEATLTQVTRELDKEFPFMFPDLADAYLLLGRRLSADKSRLDEAHRLLERCVELRTTMYGRDDARTAEAARAMLG